jgi:SAM-dependent methyltransferase
MEHSVAAYTGCDFPGNELADQPIDEADHLPFASETVDVVLSTQVLEHVANPARYLREAHRVLGRDGLLILSTHGTWRYHPDPTDFWRWTAEGLKRQIETEGFQIERLRGVMGPAATALQLWQDAVSPRVHPRLRRLFQRFMQFLIRRADLRCPTEVRDADACVYVVVARKLESHAADRRSDESR